MGRRCSLWYWGVAKGEGGQSFAMPPRSQERWKEAIGKVSRAQCDMYMYIYIYIIYTPNLGPRITLPGRGREQGCFRGSTKGARRRSEGAISEHGGAPREHGGAPREHEGALGEHWGSREGARGSAGA